MNYFWHLIRPEKFLLKWTHLFKIFFLYIKIYNFEKRILRKYVNKLYFHISLLQWMWNDILFDSWNLCHFHLSQFDYKSISRSAYSNVSNLPQIGCCRLHPSKKRRRRQQVVSCASDIERLTSARPTWPDMITEST